MAKIARGYLTVGKLARAAKVNLQTVLYYERRGLLKPAARTEAGYRLYAKEATRVLQFIKNAQGLGFSLQEISSLLRLKADRKSDCEKAEIKARAKLNLVREKIAALKSMDRALVRLIQTCAKRVTTNSCPILETLSDGKGGRNHGK